MELAWNFAITEIISEYNETQCDKRNTYRRKVKEDKAAAAVQDEVEAPKDGEPAEGVNGAVNGHAETEDEDRPMKKFKALDGTAIVPDADGLEDDEMDADQDGGQEEDEDHHDDEIDDDEGDDDEDERAEENEGVVVVDDPDPADLATAHDMRDEALDDPNSDSD